MDTATIRARIDNAWDRLPMLFTLRDVLQTAGIPKNDGRVVHDILDGMVDSGRLFRSMVPPTGNRGRRPTAWSKEACGVCEEVLVALVRAVLPKLPRLFSMTDLLRGIQMPRTALPQALCALTRLVAEGTVIRIAQLPRTGRRGRPVQNYWTADARLMAEEAALEIRHRQMQREDNPLLRPTWNPATFEDPVSRLSLPDPAKLGRAK